MKGAASLIGALLALTATASATTVTLKLPGKEKPRTTCMAYVCPGQKVAVTYINTSANQFAVLDLGKTTVVAVSVISGSGARYVGQQYEWWTKGSEATFTDLMQSPQKPVTCKQAE
ncbi:MliC family protein [Mesorhizobium sp. 1M-11]|uniref:MliC family protein n=1 Tax=Mesorhizobium sp. 1M-11 TaxID=1529006 RepID=UPI001379E4F1|nr:MliC family protein [Mesorhizobium sp. 1M-11]